MLQLSLHQWLDHNMLQGVIRNMPDMSWTSSCQNHGALACSCGTVTLLLLLLLLLLFTSSAPPIAFPQQA
jgi:hypothetical protein